MQQAFEIGLLNRFSERRARRRWAAVRIVVAAL